MLDSRWLTSFYNLRTRELLKINGHRKTSESTVRKNIISVGLNVISIILGYFIAPVIMLIASALIFSMWFIPDKNIEKMFK
ncbi:hypothetical protein [Lactococcus cremoris]|uniref:hypothetical protein n=1 Tax=Lactococcus lactis subsp. cremoris TaxID=1359 RepID=UPI0020B67435|nr:hypothetical protein [Lactococcus cremoris]